MMKNLSDWEKYQTDVLFLLVGTNPLPNYVAGCLLAKPNATLYLLHSQRNGENTYEVAQRLKAALKRPECRQDLRIEVRGISRSDPEAIHQRMQDILSEVPPSTHVGLNYTGGTKAMSVHVYHAVHEAYPDGVYSYLDATSLRMIINLKGIPTQQMLIGRDVKLDFRTLFGLHGYKLVSARRDAKQVDFCSTLAKVHSTSEGVKQWRAWLQTFGNKEREPQLPTANEYPALKPVIEAFANLCGGSPTKGGVATALGCRSLKSCAKFFSGGWLEEFTYHALTSTGIAFDDQGLEIQANKRGADKLDLDVASIWGYQLFAISCMVTEKKQKAKEHLFEVFVRARQLGGDEARIGLVSCVSNPAALQAEIEERWDAKGKIRVFGQSHLPELSEWLKDWIRTANKEVQ